MNTLFRGHKVNWDPSLFFLMEFKDKRTGAVTRIFDLTKDGYVDLAVQCNATELSERFEHISVHPLTENSDEKKSKITNTPELNPVNKMSTGYAVSIGVQPATESEENHTERSVQYLVVAVSSASVTINGIHVERAIEITSQTIRRKRPVSPDQLTQLAGTTALKQAIQTALRIKKGELDKIARDILKIKPEHGVTVVTVEDGDVPEPEEGPKIDPEELARKEKELMG